MKEIPSPRQLPLATATPQTYGLGGQYSELSDYISQKISFLKDRKVLVIVPDGTRSFPHKDIFMILDNVLPTCDYMIALGTHPQMPMEEMAELFSLDMEEYEAKYSGHKLISHNYKDESELKLIGVLSKEKIKDLSQNMFYEEVPVKINKHIFEYDHILICGPVFPHEVVGCSGGHKYFFPGISGREITDFFHWLGACIFQKNIIGIKDTPVRRVVEEASGFVTVSHSAFCLNVKENQILDIYYGDTREAWSFISDKVQKTHIKYTGRAYKTVLSLCPEMYKDIWTAGKCMYKLEPVLEEGANLIIYAPHIDEISYTHGEVLREIGYHTRDYFLRDWNRFKSYPWGILAHSTHVKGCGKMEGDIEKPNANVILATSIPEDLCKSINLGYMDYRSINIEDYTNREDEGVLVVPHAGEILYRI
ncbi:MAG: DUF2088 domain-containing protein [Abditibacteriota bacterium]|nr:DUF2088 domain-containing protein [Abditibacteriota bacterium]